MKLSRGAKAPNFTLTDIDGRIISLSDYNGKKVLLSFYRNVHCPFCNVRIHHLSLIKNDLDQNNLSMLFFFESSGDILRKSLFHKEVQPIPLISDPEKKIYREFGVESSTFKMLSTFLSSQNRKTMGEGSSFNLPEEKDKKSTANLIPADFLLDKNLNIVKAHYGSNMNDHINIKEIEAFAKQS